MKTIILFNFIFHLFQIDGLVSRGERLELLVDKAEDLQAGVSIIKIYFL